MLTQTEEQAQKIIESSTAQSENSLPTNSKNLVCCIDLDDFYSFSGGLNELLKIKNHYPNFKITLFTIPFPAIFLFKGMTDGFNMKRYKDWVKVVKQFDWIEIAIHGTGHIQGEYNCSKSRAKKSLLAGENVLKEVGLPYKKIFRAPYWQLSQDALEILHEMGYAVALNPEVQSAYNIPEGMKTYSFNWNLRERYPKNQSILLGHGHMVDYNNGLNKILYNILELPTNTEFKWVSEMI